MLQPRLSNQNIHLITQTLEPYLMLAWALRPWESEWLTMDGQRLLVIVIKSDH